MTRRWRLFPKYALLIIALVGGMLVASGMVGSYFAYLESRAHLEALQAEKALGAATRIEQYVQDIERQLSWTALPRSDPGGDALEARRIEYVKLLRQAPAITEVAWIDPGGREQLRISRLAMDVVGGGADVSQDPKFVEAKAGKIYFGPVYFRKGTEPYMTIARPAGSGGGVTVAEVNLKFVWEVVSRIRIGQAGLAYVVDASGTLIAHPDISLVLKKTDLKTLPQVAALALPDGGAAPVRALDLKGAEVLAAHAPIPTLGWTVFVETPRAEAFAPIYVTVLRLALVLAVGLAIAMAASFFLARALVRPLRALQQGAERIGAGELDRTIVVETGDELEGLAEQFNKMSADLKASYAGLERKVAERTAELSESLDYQTAISEVLRVISQSPTDVTPVFEAIMDSALRLFGSPMAAVFRFDGRVLHLEAMRNWPDEALRQQRTLYPGPPDPRMLTGRVILSGRTVAIADTLTDPHYDADTARVGGWRRMLGTPLLKDGVPVGALALAWAEPGETPQRHADLLTTFADQAVIAIENVRLINETKEALDRQTATAEVLRAISSSVADTRPVFDSILRSCERLFGGSVAVIDLLGADEAWHLAGYLGPNRAVLDEIYPVPLQDSASNADEVLRHGAIHFADVAQAADMSAPLRRGCEAVGCKSLAMAPMLWQQRRIGTILVGRGEVAPFSQKELALLQTFADQAVIAIQNARLFNETREALERQTATAEVLQVIGGSMADARPVFDKILESCRRLFDDAEVGLMPIGDDGTIDFGAHLGSAKALIEDLYPRRFGDEDAGSAIAAALAGSDVVHIPDTARVAGLPRTMRVTAERMGHYGIIVAPMLWEGRDIGSIYVVRQPPGPFSDNEIALLKTFAGQAVVAIQNARLFNETRSALERQTATSEVLRVISESPTDVQPVLDAVALRARLLCRAEGSRVWLRDGDRLRAMTGYGFAAVGDAAGEEMLPLSRASVAGRAFVERQTVHVDDVAALVDTEYPDTREIQQRHGFRTVLAVPMLREGAAIGTLVVLRRQVKAFSPTEVGLVQTFADQAVIAIENTRLFNETKEALEHQTATSAVLQVISGSMADAQPVFDKILDSCQGLFASEQVGIFVVRDDGQVHLGAYRGAALDAVAASFPQPVDETVTGQAIRERRTVHIPDLSRMADMPAALRKAFERTGNSSLVWAPMIWEDRGVGAIFVARQPPHPFSDKEVALLKTFADQAVIAIQNARLFHEIEDKSRQLELANKHKSEFLANMSHELRTPLNAIIGFSEVLAEQMFGEVNDKQKEYLQDIHTSGHHLLGLINDILDLSKIEAGRMELDLTRFNLGLLLDNATTLVRERANRHGLALALELEEGLSDWVADERKVKQVVINLLSNAVKFTPPGGSVTLRARGVEAGVEIAVIDTGVGIAEDQQAVVFEEFRQAGGDYLRKAEGTGLGLSLARRFVELHGGTIRVDSAPGKGSSFAFTLPQRMLEAI